MAGCSSPSVPAACASSQKGQLLPEPVSGTPTVWERQDGGLFDVEVHPQYARNGWIYISYAEPGPKNTAPPSAAAAAAAGLLPGRGGGAPPNAPAAAAPGAAPTPPAPPAATQPTTANPTAPRPDSAPGPAPAAPAAANTSNTVIVRGKINAKNEWVEQQVIFRAKPELYTAGQRRTSARASCSIANGHLFFTLGERGQMTNAQDLSNPLGKIHRVNDDGTIPKDNPFVNRPDAFPSIWSYGHRNPQGLACDPVSGKLWESEHGPTGGDEVNIIEPGKNYGWGVITMGIQPGITKRAEAGMEQPIVYYTPTIAPSGIAFYSGEPLCGLEEQPVRLGAGRPAAAPARDRRRQGHAPGSAVQSVRPRARRDRRAGRLSLRHAAAAGPRPRGFDARDGGAADAGREVVV